MERNRDNRRRRNDRYNDRPPRRDYHYTAPSRHTEEPPPPPPPPPQPARPPPPPTLADKLRALEEKRDGLPAVKSDGPVSTPFPIAGSAGLIRGGIFYCDRSDHFKNWYNAYESDITWMYSHFDIGEEYGIEYENFVSYVYDNSSGIVREY